MANGSDKEAVENPSGRFSIARLKSVKLEEINVLKALESYGLHHSIMRSLRVAGKPITPHHLTMMSPHVKREASVKRYNAYPPQLFIRKRAWYLNAAIIAEIYCGLDTEFAANPEGSVDAKHLLDCWEIFLVSRRKSAIETVEQTADKLKRDGLDIRVGWQILESIAWNLISLEHCGECRRPYLKVREAEIDSTWMSLTTGCASCSEIRKITARTSDAAEANRRRRQRPKVDGNSALYGAFSEQVGAEPADTVQVCDDIPQQKRLFSV